MTHIGEASDVDECVLVVGHGEELLRLCLALFRLW